MTVRKEMECLLGRHLSIVDFWPGDDQPDDGLYIRPKSESVVFRVTGPLGGRFAFGLSREDAGDLGRFLVEYYGEG